LVWRAVGPAWSSPRWPVMAPTGGSTVAWPGQEGSAPFYGRPKIDGDVPRCTRRPLLRSTASKLGRHAHAGEGGDGPTVKAARHGEGAASDRLGARAAWGRRGASGCAASGRARGPGRRGGDPGARRALWRAGARATSGRPGIVSDWPCSSDENSIFCN
jgi:hypothetical protein